MLKIVTPLFLLVCFSVCTLGSYHSIPADHQDHPGKCWFAEKEVEMNVGDKLTSTKLPCVQYKCMKSGDAFYFDRAGCSEFRVFCGYRVQEGDLSKPYPDCCATAVEDKSQICIMPSGDN